MTTLLLMLAPGAIILFAFYLASGRKEPSDERLSDGRAIRVIYMERKDK